MTVRLRAHHLLCLLTYVGKGYSPAFTRNFDVVAQRLGAGEEIAIVSGPDDICAPLLCEAEPHCLRPSAVERDGRAARSLTDLLGRSIATGERFRFGEAEMRSMREAFSAGGQIRAACEGCAWSTLCNGIAGSGYAGARLHPPAGNR